MIEYKYNTAIADALPALAPNQFWMCLYCKCECEPVPHTMSAYTDFDREGNMFDVPEETLWFSDCHGKSIAVFDDDFKDFVELPENT